MKHTLRLGWTILVAGVTTLLINYPSGLAQPVSIFTDTPAYLSHSSQGYLGIDMHDIDNDRATALKLKDVHGAEIVTVDHDAPANKAGLKIHDVILEMNGQRVEGAEQLRRMLRETPAGHTVHFIVSRDGQQQNISVELADRAKVEANAWSQHFTVPDPSEAPILDGLAAPSSSHGFGSGFLGVFGANSLYVGADVDAISTQLANYFGVTDGAGLLVRSVDENSPAATAGLKAGDVITKVNNNRLATRSDWLKALHTNRGKQVQLTVMRDKKEQKLNMQAGEPKKKGELDVPGFSPGDFASPELRAQLESSLALMKQQAADAERLSENMQKQFKSKEFQEMQKQLEKMQEDLPLHELN
ncbi:MAG TPA: PDZ domain-containing protein [Pseudacidobacterium sp.]|jgi:S1-C subfamily serine protease|nr:PDZ domain-containing protein [Pseudacidobacterium sp.]